MFRQSVPLHDLLGTYGLHEEGGLGMVAEAAAVLAMVTSVDAIKHTPS